MSTSKSLYRELIESILLTPELSITIEDNRFNGASFRTAYYRFRSTPEGQLLLADLVPTIKSQGIFTTITLTKPVTLPSFKTVHMGDASP